MWRFTGREAAARLFRSAQDNVADALGMTALGLGLTPPRSTTPRLALEQWRAAIANFEPGSKGRVLIVAFRNRTWIEWAVFAACSIYRLGYRPILVYSSQEIARVYREQRLSERVGFSFWEGVKRLSRIDRIDLDQCMRSGDGLEAAYAQFASTGAPTIAAYDLRVEEFDESDEYRTKVASDIRMLEAYGAAAERVLRSVGADRAICPSGLIGWSMAFREAAMRTNTKTAFVEAWAMRPGHMIWRVNDSALQYDLDGWMRVLGSWDDSKERDARDFAAFQERADVNRDGWLDDFHPVQRTPRVVPLPQHVRMFLERPGPCVLMGTNVIGDSSILQRASLFRNQQHWVQAVIEFLRSRQDLNLIIRAHPDEVWARARCKVADFARAAAQSLDNVLVIGGDEDLNTYAIADRAAVCLAWVSNIGLDMVLRGKPAILAAKAQYARLGIGISPSSIDEYFHEIDRQAYHPTPPPPDMILRAKTYQHIVFKMMSLRATGTHYATTEYRLAPDTLQPERSKFFRILVGELTPYGRPAQSTLHRPPAG